MPKSKFAGKNNKNKSRTTNKTKNGKHNRKKLIQREEEESVTQMMDSIPEPPAETAQIASLSTSKSSSLKNKMSTSFKKSEEAQNKKTAYADDVSKANKGKKVRQVTGEISQNLTND